MGMSGGSADSVVVAAPAAGLPGPEDEGLGFDCNAVAAENWSRTSTSVSIAVFVVCLFHNSLSERMRHTVEVVKVGVRVSIFGCCLGLFLASAI